MGESQVRAVQQSDVGALTALATETFPIICPPEITDENIAVFVEENLSPERFRIYLDASLYVVSVHRIGEGLDCYLLMMAGDGSLPDSSFRVMRLPTTYLSKCYVHLNRRGDTVSKALLDEAKRVAAADLRAAFIQLSTNQGNIRARRSYKKRGFVGVGTKTVPVNDHICDDYVYEHVLTTS